MFVTDVTLAEITYGIEQLGDAGRRTDLRLWLERNLRPLFAGRILAITEDVIVRWKFMVVEGQKRGHTFGQPDLFIAAIAALQASVLHINGDKAALKAPATVDAAAKIISNS